jgi:hypothetical protein
VYLKLPLSAGPTGRVLKQTARKLVNPRRPVARQQGLGRASGPPCLAPISSRKDFLEKHLVGWHPSHVRVHPSLIVRRGVTPTPERAPCACVNSSDSEAGLVCLFVMPVPPSVPCIRVQPQLVIEPVPHAHAAQLGGRASESPGQHSRMHCSKVQRTTLARVDPTRYPGEDSDEGVRVVWMPRT